MQIPYANALIKHVIEISYIHRFFNERPIACLYKFSFFYKIAIALLAKMHFQIFNADRIAVRYIGNIDCARFRDHQQSSPVRCQWLPSCCPCYQHAGIFSQTNTDAGRICSHGLCQSAKASSFFKMRINDHIIHKTKSGSDFYFAFQMGTGGIPFIDHGTAHGHGTG